MNKHIELLEKWLADPLSVSQAELKANHYAAALAATNAANDTYAAANFTATTAAENAAYYAANASDDVFYAAYESYTPAYTSQAAEWVAKYHKEVQAVARKKIIHDGGVVFDADGKTIDELKELLTPHIRRNDNEQTHRACKEVSS